MNDRRILICNAGSTSLKFKLFDMPAERVLARGQVERIGMGGSIFTYENPNRALSLCEENLNIDTYTQGIGRFLDRLTGPESGALHDLAEISAVGFKTVLSRGFPGTHILTEEVKEGMRRMMTVAPAHNGPYLEAIGVFEKLLPDAPRVGAFETAFHTTIPDYRRDYAVPYAWIEHCGVRKMGYHGASHRYVSEKLGGRGRVISCHLGGSSSLCAILDGRSIDNSFGLSLQAGIPHNNRVGELDAFVIFYMLDQGLTPEEVKRALLKEAGLKGISGGSGDMRDLLSAMEAGDGRARLAFQMYADAICRTVGAYAVELNGLDTLCFTGGIGEHCAVLREAVCEKLACLGVRLDAKANADLRGEGLISPPDSPVAVRVIQTDEERMVARETWRALEKEGAPCD